MLKKTLSVAALCTMLNGAIAQEVRLNPTPQKMEITQSGTINTQNGFRLTDSEKALADALAFTTKDKNAVKLSVRFGAKIAKKHDVPAVAGAYTLKATPKGISIIGYDEQGAYYGIQTLLQLSANGSMPSVEITDFPDLPYRGVVEGFYGTPWSHQVRLSLIDFYGKNKLNTYLYGPKDDPYHSCPKWREPYPEKEAQNIHELVEACRRNRVDFVWAIHPGQDIKWNEEDYGKLLGKLEKMYDLGVRSFALFFDDISGEGTNAVKQAELLNRLHKEFVLAKKDVSPLIMCPTDYTKLWADPAPDGYLSILGNTLDPSIHVMWTGDYICCDITDKTLEWVNSRIKRPTFIWWNYPVTDYVRYIIMQGPVYGSTQKASKNEMAGFVSNPMEHGEASKLALYGVADYTWNLEAYKPKENWEHGLGVLMPEAKEAYRTFAIHSTDTETGYRREESWDTETFTIDNYTPAQYDALKAEFARVKQAPSTIFTKAANKQLVKELTPWLIEFEKLGARGLTTMDQIKQLEQKEYASFWNSYISSQMTEADVAAYKANRAGTTKLQPFVERTREDMGRRFYGEVSGVTPVEVKAIGTYATLATMQSKAITDQDINTYYHSAMAQKAGDWVGLDLGKETEIKHLVIRQGRNEPNDVDYFDNARVEISLDNQNWQTLLDNLVQQYEIVYEGTPVTARYVRLVRSDDSTRKNWFALRCFDVNPVRKNPTIYTNVAQLLHQKVESEGNKVTVAPALEVINVKPGEFFGVEMPIATYLTSPAFDLGNKSAQVEYSVDGKSWTNKPGTARYVRYCNHSEKPVALRLKKFEFTTVSSDDAEMAKAFDMNPETYYASKEKTQIAIPAATKSAVLLLSDTDKAQTEIRQMNAKGVLIASTRVENAYCPIEIDPKATTLEVNGAVNVNEVIFK